MADTIFTQSLVIAGVFVADRIYMFLSSEIGLTFQQIAGACIAVILAGAPVMVALLKIKELHVDINGSLDALVEASRRQAEILIMAADKLAEDRSAANRAILDASIAAATREAELRIIEMKAATDRNYADLRREMERVRSRNDELVDKITEIMGAVKKPVAKLDNDQHE